MLHCPRTIARTIVYSGVFLATGLALPALAADPTGDWKVADGVANIRVAQCNGNMWGVVAWEKTPGGKDKNNPDAAKQSRPTLGHADPDRHEEEARRRCLGRPSLQRQGRTALQLDDQAGRHRPARDSGLRARASSAAVKPGPASGRRFPRAPPTAWPRVRRRAHQVRRRRPAPAPAPAAPKTTGAAIPRRRAESCARSEAGRDAASPPISAISAYSPTSRGLPISAGWNSSTAASVMTNDSASNLPMLAVPG